MLITDKLYANIVGKKFSELPNNILSELIYNEIIVDESENEFEEILNQNIESLKDEKNLDVTIQPTANCQLGCGYCGQVHSKKNMSDDYKLKIIIAYQLNGMVANLF
jgi:uncharacterized protein